MNAGAQSFTETTSDLSAVANRFLHAPRVQVLKNEADTGINDMNMMRHNI